MWGSSQRSLLVFGFEPLGDAEKVKRYGQKTCYEGTGRWHLLQPDGPLSRLTEWKLETVPQQVSFFEQPECSVTLNTYDVDIARTSGVAALATVKNPGDLATSFMLRGLRPDRDTLPFRNKGVGSRCHLIVGRPVFVSALTPPYVEDGEGEATTMFAFQGRRTDTERVSPLYLVVIPAGCVFDAAEVSSGQETLIVRRGVDRTIEWSVKARNAKPEPYSAITTAVEVHPESETHDLR